MSSVDIYLGPGKCAPRFIKDLIQYDAALVTGIEENILTCPPEKLDNGEVKPVAPPPGSCRHNYILKPNQCILPPPDTRPTPSTIWKVSSTCLDCQCHMDLVVDYRKTKPENPCPAENYPLHHLRYAPSLSAPKDVFGAAVREVEWTDHHCFACSSPNCGAVVTVTTRPPRLRPQFLSLLTNREKIRERVQKELDAAPQRLKAYRVPEPHSVIHILRQYVQDALNSENASENRKQFSSSNKMFLSHLGEPCRDLLEYLGFTYNVTDDDNTWTLPTVFASEIEPRFRDNRSVLLDDAHTELICLQNKRPLAERVKHLDNLPVTASIREIERALGAQGCETTFDDRQTKAANFIPPPDATVPIPGNLSLAIGLTTPESPFYIGLGAVDNFADVLLVFAYDRQRTCDNGNTPFYLGYLRELANARRSEALELKVAEILSDGEVTRWDVNNAYQYFGIDERWGDQAVIGAFQSRLTDAPLFEAQARQHLRAIGIARRSEAIKSVASKTVSSYTEALTYLGAEENLSDEFIVTLYTMKVDDDPTSADIGRRAVSLIAEHRNSDMLRNWLATGIMETSGMSADKAYARLGIESGSIDDDTIVATYEIRIAEAPSDAEEMRAALETIGRARNSHRIAEYLRSPGGAQLPSASWPVGLENIGNTCYLNSLLQFYFTVKPLRELILDFQQFEMGTSPEEVERKRVGSRKVTLREIERAKLFVFELRKLFINLITARSSAITPERELARLTLIKSSDEEDYRRRSTITSQGRPPLGEINGMPIQGPSLPAELSDAMDVDPSASSASHVDALVSDTASEATLVDNHNIDSAHDVDMANSELSKAADNGTEQQLGIVMVDSEKEEQRSTTMTENDKTLAANDDHSTEAVEAQVHASSLNSSGSQEDGTVQQTNDTLQNDSDVAMADEPTGTTRLDDAPPPERPPPVPPRPEWKSTDQKPVDELELGAQQDVTEVIGNVLFQLECALRPKRIDESGEQLDEIKDLFYGKARSVIDVQGVPRAKEEYFSDIKVNVATGPRDIYAALDGAFDVQEVTIREGKFPQYTTIAQLPPVLQIQVQRVQYDVTNKKTYKSDAHLYLRNTIYLDRYMDLPSTEMHEKRQQSWRLKEYRQMLAARKSDLLQTQDGISTVDALNYTRQWLENIRSISSDLGIDEEALADLNKGALSVQRELEDIDAKVNELDRQIEHLFDSYRQYAYRLATVFIHRGTATFGHYWVYIYDFQNEVWRKYNDGYVTEVADEREIFEQEGGDDSQNQNWGGVPGTSSNGDQHQPYQSRYKSPVATPYYLVYVSEPFKHAIINPVCREFPKASPNPPPDGGDSCESATPAITAAPSGSHEENGELGYQNDTSDHIDSAEADANASASPEAEAVEMQERPGNTKGFTEQGIADAFWKSCARNSGSNDNENVQSF